MAPAALRMTSTDFAKNYLPYRKLSDQTKNSCDLPETSGDISETSPDITETNHYLTKTPYNMLRTLLTSQKPQVTLNTSGISGK